MRRLLLPLFLLLITLAAPLAAHAQNLMTGCDKNTFELKYEDPEVGNDKTGRVSGKVRFVCDSTQVFADEIRWDEKNLYGKSVLVIQDGLRVNAERMEMDRTTRLGTFFVASGTARLTANKPEPSAFGTQEPEVIFAAERIEKIGPRTYRMTKGWFTTCLQASPRWEMRGTDGTITLNERVLLKNALLRVKGVPVFYLPVIYYPLSEDDRSTGLLIPTYSTSSVRGHGVSNAYFLALSRSQDATLYYDYFSKSGQGFGAQYRAVPASGSNGELNFYMLNERASITDDGVVQRNAHRYYELRGQLSQQLTRQLRLIARTNYTSDATTQQLFQQNLYNFSQRDRYLSADVTGNYRYARLSARAERRDIFLDLNTARRTGYLPKVNVWVNDRPIGRSRVYVGASGELANIDNQSNVNDPATSRGLWRIDAMPTIRAPLSKLSFLYATTSASWRFTRWTDSQDPLTREPTSVELTRTLFEWRADLVGPVFSKVIRTPKNGYAEGFKHLIEPRISYSWLSPFTRQTEVLVSDSFVDSVPVGNATLNYALNNRLLAKVRGTGAIRDVLTVGISQSYYTQESASLLDKEYQTATAGSFSPVRITATSTPTDHLTGQFQMSVDHKTRRITSYSLTTALTKTLAQVNAGWSRSRFLTNVPGFDNLSAASHFLNARAAFRTRSGRFGANYGFNLDVKSKRFADQRFGASYNAQCCGISADYQIADLSHLGLQQKTDRRFNFSVTLAGIGSFSNPMGAFGNNTGVR